MRLWILVGGGVLILGAAIWPLRAPRPPAAPQVAPAIAVQPRPSESPKPEPPRMIEVIDLARAYEPVREPEEPAGAVNPASLIQVPDGPKRIPAAIELDTLHEASSARTPRPERIDVMPRELTGSVGSGLLKPLPTGGVTACGLLTAPGELVAAPVERINAAPRELTEFRSGVAGQPAVIHYERSK